MQKAEEVWKQIRDKQKPKLFDWKRLKKPIKKTGYNSQWDSDSAAD
jgi:hypothetical protein